ncbi:aminopeptidase Y, Metallo peptidase, MEROPS family M28A [Mycobacterium kansasii 662]|uniref:Aminopeptidase Y, Metallo peptidase, MEROPS family M28A n=1 Tax=Mycobacterium kansasii 662 TaxID=1299326 RepID=X7ZA14_MYCKA|nr:aminopeptidase Y, Metallo peptidase, MEROPS family M28A [Mycobacterium kansasii 662]
MVVVIALLVVGCVHSSGCPQAFTGNPAAAEFADALHNRVHTEAMMAHLAKLQDIANANNGTRAVGTRATRPASTTSSTPCATAVLTCRHPSFRPACSTLRRGR